MKRVMWPVSIVAGVATLGALMALHANARAADAPASLGDVGEFGENLYDLAKANDWAKAAVKFDELKAAAKKLAGELRGSAVAKGWLDETIAALGRAVAAKDRKATLRQANRVTLIATDLTEPFKPQVPSAVTRLDVYGRELEMGAAAKDPEQLKAAVRGLHTNWDAVKAAVKAKGGQAEARRFDALMAQLDAAKSSDDYAKLAKPILDEVDNLEKVFGK